LAVTPVAPTTARHETAVDPAGDGGGVGDHVGELDVVEGPGQEGGEVPVQLGAAAADLDAADPRGDPGRGDRVIDAVEMPCT